MKLIIDIDEKWEAKCLWFSDRDIMDYLYGIVRNGTPIPDNATPCDFCRYNPPSSTDGKPCCMCPATPYQKGGKE